MPNPAGQRPQRQFSAAAERNSEAILAQLRRLLPPAGLALEIASGTGQHAARLGTGLPGWRWQPSDAHAGALASIAAWCEGLAGVLPPLWLDVMEEPWSGVPATVDAIFCANLLHIAPWATCAGLMRGAQRHLAADGRLIIYGPFRVDGEPTAPSNLAFDADLRQRDPAWGLRALSDVVDQAREGSLGLLERVEMPANNQLLVFVHRGGL